MKNKLKILIAIAVFIFAIFLFFLFSVKKEFYQSGEKKINFTANNRQQKTKELSQGQKYCNFFPKRRREDYIFMGNEKAGIAILFDKSGKQKILYQKSIKDKLPIASLTKLMTAMVVLDNYDLKKNVEVSKSAIDAPEEVGKLRPGEKISVEGLLDLTLLVSSNDAAQALAEIMGEDKFIQEMNKKAKEIGLLDTHFVSAHGFEDKNHSTAYDLALLTQYSILHYPLIWKILGVEEMMIKGKDSLDNEIVHSPKNTNKLLSEQYVLGGKTGYTEEAGDTMILGMRSPGSVVDGNIVLVLLGLGIAERIPKMKNFYDWVVWGWNWGDFRIN